MDPDATLKEMRELAMSNTDEDMDRLCELVLALDGWLTKGGFQPSRWIEQDTRVDWSEKR